MSDPTVSFEAVPIAPLSWAPRLVIDPGGRAERTLTLRPGAYTVGSSKDADVHIADPHVSRAHLKLVIAERDVELVDLGSSNGTWVNGVRVPSARILDSVSVVLGRTTLSLELAAPARSAEALGEAVGRAPCMTEVFALLRRLAPTELTVTLLGETGTGKDVLARALHGESARQGKPFVVFDCGAVAPNLIESELFGHVKGAFTGAVAERKGAFEQAHGGTIFLDEIGELPLALQPRLLRVLEQRTVRRVGGTKDLSVDVRVVAATHRDLEAAVRDGRFRQDLYFRLNGAVVSVPPLRARLDDLPLLIEAIMRDAGRMLRVDPAALAVLASHDWPGNVRELKNVVASALAFADGAVLGAPHFARIARSGKDASIDRLPLAGRTLDALERAAIRQTLERHGGNKTQAAQALGIAASTLYEKIKKYKI